jgi:hypothetical protein
MLSFCCIRERSGNTGSFSIGIRDSTIRILCGKHVWVFSRGISLRVHCNVAGSFLFLFLLLLVLVACCGRIPTKGIYIVTIDRFTIGLAAINYWFFCHCFRWQQLPVQSQDELRHC